MKKAVTTVSFMVVATMLAKIMGLVRDMFMTNSYGLGAEAVAYANATRIPIMFFDLTLGVAILSTFIPVFNRFLLSGDKKRAFDFSNSFINLVALVSILFCVIGIMFSKQLVVFIAPGNPESWMLTSQLLILLLPTTIFTALAYAFVGILQSFDEFNIPAIISVVSNLAVIIYLMFFNQTFGIFGLAVAMLIGWSLQVFIQIPSLIEKGYKYRFVLNLRDEGIKDVFILALPILISSWVQPISVMINTIFASYLNSGQAVPALDYANRLYIIIVGVFTFGITNYIFPSLSKMSGGGDDKGFITLMKQSIRVMLLIIAPIMAGMMLLSRQIITVVYGRGAFDQNSIIMTSTALFFFSIGMISFGFNEILNKSFYADKDGKTPMIASVFGISTTIVLSYVFTRVLGFDIGGLALSSATSATVVSIILLIKMNKKNIKFIDTELVLFAIKVAAATGIMAIVAFFARQAVASFGILFQIIVTAVAGIIVYFPLLWVFKVKEVREVFK